MKMYIHVHVVTFEQCILIFPSHTDLVYRRELDTPNASPVAPQNSHHTSITHTPQLDTQDKE